MRWLALLVLVGCGRVQFDALADAGVGVVAVADNSPSRLGLGFAFTCLVRDDGTVTCWGIGARGRLGNGGVASIGDDEPASAAGPITLGGTATQISSGTDHTCVRLTTGNVRCWGVGTSAELGYQNLMDIGDNEVPATAGDVDVGDSVAEVVAGGLQACVRLDRGAVRCWGSASAGRLGYGNAMMIGDDEPPAAAGDVRVGGSVQQIRTRASHTCALLVGGTIRCWGNGATGQLGYGSTTDIGDNELPDSAGDVPLGGAIATQIALGANHTCALLAGGRVRCWGNGADGRLGQGDTRSIGDDETPDTIGDIDVGAPVVQISAGANHTCARLASGAVRCWGLNQSGQLGYGNTQNVGDDEPPASAGDIPLGGRAVEIMAGGTHTCARLDTGSVRCWGQSDVGQLGYGTTTSIGDDETPESAGDVPL